MYFLELQREPGVLSQVTVGMAMQSSCLSAMSGLLSSYKGNVRNLHKAWQAIRLLLELRR